MFLWCFSPQSKFCASVIYGLEAGLVHFARCKIVEASRVKQNKIMCLLRTATESQIGQENLQLLSQVAACPPVYTTHD